MSNHVLLGNYLACTLRPLRLYDNSLRFRLSLLCYYGLINLAADFCVQNSEVFINADIHVCQLLLLRMQLTLASLENQRTYRYGSQSFTIIRRIFRLVYDCLKLGKLALHSFDLL